MTPAEIVACVQSLCQRAAFTDNAIYYQNDQKAYEHARAAFHEAAKLLDLCAPKTCGTCADARHTFDGDDGTRWCGSQQSYCAMREWPADHGCPQWRRKYGAA